MSDFKVGDVVLAENRIKSIREFGVITEETDGNADARYWVKFSTGWSNYQRAIDMRHATPEEKEKFYRMTEETTEYRAGPQFKVGDEVLVKAEILQDLADDNSTEEDNTILLRIGNGIRVWQPRTAIHSHAPKEPVDTRFKDSPERMLRHLARERVIEDIAKPATSEKTPIIGYDFGEVGGDKSVEFTTHFAIKGEKVVRFSEVEERAALHAINYLDARIHIQAALDSVELSKNELKVLEIIDMLRQKLMGAE